MPITNMPPYAERNASQIPNVPLAPRSLAHANGQLDVLVSRVREAEQHLRHTLNDMETQPEPLLIKQDTPPVQLQPPPSEIGKFYESIRALELAIAGIDQWRNAIAKLVSGQ